MRADSFLALCFQFVCVLYLIVALLYALLQRRYATRHARTSRSREREHKPWPVVDVLVTCYNEEPALMDACCKSLAAQDYPGPLRVFLVDDGSRNRRALLPVLERHGRRPGWRVLLLDRNEGKRRAQDAAFRQGSGEVIVMLDSDTVILPGGIRQIVQPFEDGRIGAVSGNLRALNAAANALTRLINRRYWLLFEQERAMQSYFRAVRCCCGGFAAYRRAALEAIWSQYVDQTFRGRRCSTGDDSHLTLQVLASGYDSVLQADARALTCVPASPLRYARQQLRWSRSFIRELPQAVRAIAGRPVHLAFDLAAQVSMPLVLTAAMVLYLAESMLLSPDWLASHLVLIVATVGGTSITGAVQGRSLEHLLYAPIYLALVLPGWLRALVSPGQDNWSTRETSGREGSKDGSTVRQAA